MTFTTVLEIELFAKFSYVFIVEYRDWKICFENDNKYSSLISIK